MRRALIVVACAGLLLGCQRTGMVGDSLGGQARPHLPDSWRINTLPGRPMAGEQVPNVANRIAVRSDALVIVLGTNDVARGHDPATMRQSIRRVRHAVRGTGTCIVWIGVKRHGVNKPGAANGDWETHARAFNQALLGMVNNVANWNSPAQRHPHWFGPDGLHLTDAGAFGFAAFLGRQVNRHC